MKDMKDMNQGYLSAVLGVFRYELGDVLSWDLSAVLSFRGSAPCFGVRVWMLKKDSNTD